MKTQLSQCTNSQQYHRYLLDITINPKVQNDNNSLLSTIHSSVDSHSIIICSSTNNNYKIHLTKTDKTTIIQQEEVDLSNNFIYDTNTQSHKKHNTEHIETMHNIVKQLLKKYTNNTLIRSSTQSYMINSEFEHAILTGIWVVSFQHDIISHNNYLNNNSDTESHNINR